MARQTFPRQLYRPGAQENVWGVMCDLLRVESQEELDAALADGWGSAKALLAQPEDPTAKPKAKGKS